jgi:hypothetical protein
MQSTSPTTFESTDVAYPMPAPPKHLQASA